MLDMLDMRDMYLDLLRSSLPRYGQDELIPIRARSHPMVRRVLDILTKRNISSCERFHSTSKSGTWVWTGLFRLRR